VITVARIFSVCHVILITPIAVAIAITATSSSTGPVHTNLSIGLLYVLLHRRIRVESRLGFPGIVLGSIGGIELYLSTGHVGCVPTHRLSMQGVQFQTISVLMKGELERKVYDEKGTIKVEKGIDFNTYDRRRMRSNTRHAIT
jgi:hypothetical protein